MNETIRLAKITVKWAENAQRAAEKLKQAAARALNNAMDVVRVANDALDALEAE